MGGMFSSPKKPDLPPPQAIPEVDEEGLKKTLRKRGGRGKTLVTGELEPFMTSKQSLLG